MNSINQKEKKQNIILLSIVVPVYNGGSHIEKCISSIQKQTHSNIEIIIVNDGSSDNTYEVCKELANEDKRIIILNQPNKGVIEARRSGIRIAKGNYITFVDADDWVEENMYETLLTKIGDTSLITSGYFKEYGKNKFLLYKDLLENGIYSGERMQYLRNNLIYMQENGYEPISTNLWSKIFITKKVKELAEYDYGEVYYGEDALFLYNYILNVDSVTITDEAFYHYCVREDNATNSINANYLGNISKFYLTAMQIIKDVPEFPVLKIQLEKQIIRMFFSGVNTRMGFSEENRVCQYCCKDLLKLSNNRVVLYGAGEVGIDYYYHFKKYGVNVVAWVDQGMNKSIFASDMVTRVVPNSNQFDYIVIAIKSEAAASEIKEYLINSCSISSEKIIWNHPDYLV